MKKYLFFLAAFVLMFLPASFWVAAEETGNNPVTVSPGSETEVATVWQSCPTFSWSAVDQAASYRIAIFESVDANVATYEGMSAMGSPVINKDISGPALSWTLSAEESLKTGSTYAWYIQALDVAGNAIGSWSDGRVFKVEQELRFAGIEEKLGEILKSYSVSEETTSNVLNDLKSEVKEVVVHSARSKNTPDVSRVQGYEGNANTVYGQYAGSSISTGFNNAIFGGVAGFSNTTGYSNTFIGQSSGYSNTSGNFNIFLGNGAGGFNTTGIANVSIGNSAGNNNTIGNGNIFIGHKAGFYETNSNKLYISNSDTSSPLIYGEFDNSLLNINGNLRVTGYLSLDNGATQINSTELNLLHGITSVSMGSNNNDKLVTKGYVDENDDVGGGGLTGSDMTDTYICKWDDANTRLVDSLISESPGVIKVNGKLGIGTSTPAYPVEVDTTGSNSCILVKRTDGASNYINATNAYANFGSTTNHPLRLVVNSAWKMRLNQNGSLNMSNGATLTTGGVWTNASSRALKENIENLSVDEAVAALIKLNPVKYNYKVDKTDKHVGFIAEDVPELIAATDRKGLSPMDVTAVLTKVVQALQKESQEQQKVIQEYKKIISDLQERMIALEKK